ncbi:hypothetical protein [Streptomyces capitiformicae]|uniref:Uncharacterized protein n=1 Tax=Streptomyces capitiformicae TaxID=2014920 RepID=A0A919GGW6_9ACTN|nr:hypothetical protein [Streptomyces capitiformicae]GHH83849.1 hypothetical protein GCM10017771_11480 [Streptomyces capitiformicae]
MTAQLPDDVTEEELAAALRLVRRRQTAHARPPVKDEGTVFIRGEGGAVFEVTPSKMTPDMKRRLMLGYLRQVNADGSPLRESAPAAPAAPAGGSALTQGQVPRPAKSAPKKDWVLYGVAVLGLDAEVAEGMTRQELIDLPADHAQHPGPTPGAAASATPAASRPDEDAPKAAWVDHIVKQGLLSREDAEAYTKDDLIAMVS